MPIAPQSHHPSLKRPRSTSQPPSPSSSSPKRAASESDDHVSVPGMDTTNAGPVGSPLRDRETDASSGSGEWVQRTEDVHLNEVEPSGGASDGQERYKALYDNVLGASTAELETLTKSRLKRTRD